MAAIDPPSAEPTPAVEHATTERRLPAWGVSIAVHLLTFALLVLALQRVAQRGAAEEPGRQVGIVLRRANADGDPYEGEDDRPDPTANDASTGKAEADLAEALPEASAMAAAASFLPKPLGLGPQASEALRPTSGAGQMTQGGAGRRRSASGGEAVVQVFGVEGVGTKFVYAFDRSPSMSDGGRLAAAKRQLIESLDSLDSIHQFQIIFFNDRTKAPDLSGGQNRVAFANEQNKLFARRFVEGVTASGGTDQYAALSHALRYTPDVIFFLTDSDHPMSVNDLAQIRRQNARVGATICTIEFGSGPPRRRDNYLKQLARSTGGQYGYVDATRLER